MAALLDVSNVRVAFGGVVALDDVTITVSQWEIVGVVGPSGSGKTTLVDCVGGLRRPDAGTVTFRGRDLSVAPAHRRAALGIARTFERPALIPHLTVVENCMVAQHSRAGYSTTGALLASPRSFARERDLRANALEVLDFLDLLDVAKTPAQALPHAEAKVVELAVVLCSDPELVLLDEPSAGIGRDAAREMAERIVKLRQELHLTVLVAERRFSFMDSCDYVYALDAGRVVAAGKSDEMSADPMVSSLAAGSRRPASKDSAQRD